MIKKSNKNNSEKFELTLETNNLRKEFQRHFLSSYMTKFEKIFIGKNLKINAFIIRSKKGLQECH